jgi:FtsZ-binding cell division protein ZapB
VSAGEIIAIVSVLITVVTGLITGAWALRKKDGDAVFKRIDELRAKIDKSRDDITALQLEQRELKGRVDSLPDHETLSKKLEKLEKHLETHIDGLANHVKDLVAVVTSVRGGRQ